MTVDVTRRYWDSLFMAMEGERSARSSAWLNRHLKALAKTGNRLVDLGCGTGDDVRVLAREGFWTVGLDFSWSALTFARDMFPRGRYVQADLRARRLPFADASFDGVIARCALHYFTLKQTEHIVDEVARILVPGGALAIVVNSAKMLSKRMRYQYDTHKVLEPRTIRFADGVVRHFFTRAELERLLRDEFEIEYEHEGVFRQYEEQRVAWTIRARKKAKPRKTAKPKARAARG
jgi:ubiquinone/menaquinone biosynthesis C-methylase UbiE